MVPITPKVKVDHRLTPGSVSDCMGSHFKLENDHLSKESTCQLFRCFFPKPFYLQDQDMEIDKNAN